MWLFAAIHCRHFAGTGSSPLPSTFTSPRHTATSPFAGRLRKVLLAMSMFLDVRHPLSAFLETLCSSLFPCSLPSFPVLLIPLCCCCLFLLPCCLRRKKKGSNVPFASFAEPTMMPPIACEVVPGAMPGTAMGPGIF